MNRLAISPNGARTWFLTEDFTAETSQGSITVPAGFDTDLASTPRLVWMIIPPFGLYTYAAVVHDYIYRYNLFDRETCDDIFYELMIKYNTARWKALIMYNAVRFFAGKVYERHGNSLKKSKDLSNS